MSKVSKILGFGKKKKMPDSDGSLAASCHTGRKEPAPLYIGKTTSRAHKILEASGVHIPIEPSRLSKRLDFPDQETLSTPTATPTTTPAPRMPSINRPDPTPSTTGHVHSSSEVPHDPPPTLFMPPMVPAIPEIDDTGRPFTSSLVSPTKAYIFVPWSEEMIWCTARRSKGKLVEDLQCEVDDMARLSQPEEKKKNTRGPSKFYALDRHVADNGRHTIPVNKYGAPVLSSDGAVAYCRYIGVLIRDRVKMLWAEWKDVPMCVKESLNNAMSVWLDIPPSLLHTWCDEEQSTKYKSWKNELHLFWEAWGGYCDSCPIEFKYREHEWNWFRVHFNDPNYKTTSTKNKTNRGRLTEHHSLGSRSLACVAHEAITSDQVDNTFAYVAKKHIHKILTNMRESGRSLRLSWHRLQGSSFQI